MENWLNAAKALGFAEAAVLDPKNLVARYDVRDMCAADKCRAYGKNWTCPPHCGTVEECQRKMKSFSRGILVQTVGKLDKDIDSRAYRETEAVHNANFRELSRMIRDAYPDALCLGAGGCRICGSCAWPEPCRFPGQALSSMEGYGLFVTQVCMDAGLPYHHCSRTVTYTSCILF